jgi:hypothetical protein
VSCSLYRVGVEIFIIIFFLSRFTSVIIKFNYSIVDLANIIYTGTLIYIRHLICFKINFTNVL